MHRLLCVFNFAAITLLFSGCAEEPPQAKQEYSHVDYAERVRYDIENLQAIYDAQGLVALNELLPSTIDDMSEYKDMPVGEHEETYKKLHERLKALGTEFEKGKPTKADADEAFQELQELLEPLPKYPRPSS